MDVNTNGFSSSGYRGGAYYGGMSSGSTSGETEPDKYFAAARKPQFGSDSLVGTALPRRANERQAAPMDPVQALKVAKIVRAASWGVAALSLFIFVIMFLQPLLLPIFTFGACFSGGFGEWLDFSYTVLKASLAPAAVAVAFSWVGYFAHRKTIELAKVVDEKNKPRITPSGLSPALMARFSEGR